MPVNLGKKLFFAFGGTGDIASNVQKVYKNHQFRSDVVRIFFNGCQDSAVSGSLPLMGYIDPDLDVVARKIRSCFVHRDGQVLLSLDKLKTTFGKAIQIDGADGPFVRVDEMLFSGFSRGAVTTFSVSRALDELNIPMSLYANDPVPGVSKAYAQNPLSEFHKNQDLRALVNLKHAVVNLGVYHKQHNPLNNRYFREMAPLFSDTCHSSIQIYPKAHHLEFSWLERNQQATDMIEQGYIQPKGMVKLDHDEVKTNLFFVPKVLRQHFHEGVSGRIGVMPRYQTVLRDLTKSTHADFTVVQTLYALRQANTPVSVSVVSEEIQTMIENDFTSKGKALREFIIEFENINQFVFRSILDDKTQQAVSDFRIQVYGLLNECRGKLGTFDDRCGFEDKISKIVSELKDRVPNKQYTQLNQYINAFMHENVLLYPELTHYMDEPLLSYPQIPSNSDELAEVLYFSSEKSRVAIYDRFVDSCLGDKMEVEQLANILRFLPPGKIEIELQRLPVRTAVKNIGDLIVLMEKLFSWQQRKKLYNEFRNEIPAMTRNPHDIKLLNQYLSENKQIPDSVFDVNVKKQGFLNIKKHILKMLKSTTINDGPPPDDNISHSPKKS